MSLVRLYQTLASGIGLLGVPVMRARAALGSGDARERLALEGPLTPDGEPSPLWCHAASVGELEALFPVLEETRRRHAELPMVVSTTTATGRAVARERAPWARAFLLPVDVPWVALRAMDRIAPRAMLIAETEIWPALIAAAKRESVPLALVNGRLSARGFRRYSLVRPLVRDSLAGFRVLAVQTAADRDRFIALGADPDRVRVAGNTKVDAEGAPVTPAAKREARARRGIPDGSPLLVAGSVRPEEFAPVLDAFVAARRAHPEARLLFAPRHLDRIALAAEEAARRALRVVRWSRPHAESSPEWDVMLLDTMGELAGAYALGEMAFVGGTLDAKYGGHNPLEPAAREVPVLFGPHRRNAALAADALLAAGGAIEVTDAATLASAMDRWIASEPDRRAAGRKAADAVRELQGAAARTVDLLEAAGFPW